MSLFFCGNFVEKTNVFAAESGETLGDSPAQQQTTISIFIRKPSYSVFYENKLYFIDEADNLLKSYNTDTHSFDSEYLDLSSYEILDASFVNKYLYLLTAGETENKVIKIDLSSLSIDLDFNVSIDKLYASFFAQEISFDTKPYTLLTYSACGNNSKVSLIDDTNFSVQSFEIKFNSSDNNHSTAMNNLRDTISYQDDTGRLYLVYIYASEIAYYKITSLENLQKLSEDNVVMQTLSHTAIPNFSSDTQDIIGIHFAEMDNKDYIAISFNTRTNYAEQHLKLYSFDFEDGTETITYKTSFTCENSKYLIFNDDYYSFVDDEEQKLFFAQISIDNSGLEPVYGQSTIEVDNPNYEIEYFNESEFIYKETRVFTALYEDPWGANFDTRIGKNTDVIKIGEVKLVGSGLKISDYDYCLYTNNNENFFGFIKNSDLNKKTALTPKDAGFKEIDGRCIVTVWPKTSLFTLPTTIAGVLGKDGSTLLSQRISTIEDSSPVEILDMLCNYYANNIQMIKVRVNNSQVGYIDANCVRNPSEIRDFVITNATIKNDDTKVYLSPSIDSTVLSFKLDAGKNVRINGKRDTRTGFTSITFNDEYGNEYSGYIETDYIVSDSWSTLQIIGCVLIAINIGLLILILIYKKNHLGNRGQKIEKES